MKQIVFTEKAPAPIGPYSQAVLAEGKFLFISGQIPLNTDGSIVGDDIKTQTRQVLENLKAIVESAGGSLNNIVKTTVLLKDIAHFAEMNEVYNEYFGESKPARAAYQVVSLPKNVLVEIEAIAVF